MPDPPANTEMTEEMVAAAEAMLKTTRDAIRGANWTEMKAVAEKKEAAKPPLAATFNTAEYHIRIEEDRAISEPRNAEEELRALPDEEVTAKGA